ncbi:MAG: Glycosyltransferase, group 2 family protein [Parcubacteria group bacterium GW2011_GWC1_39_29]|nr:MAG: Glycosyltransferase, group 2 family protein [Parcubacteria group bacterium GW2011_GWC1_39_29]
MKKTGECFVPNQSTSYEIQINVERYIYAMMLAENKTVLDAACGAGLGTYFYSLVAKKVYAVDYRQEHLEYAKEYPAYNAEYLKLDLNKDLLPEHDLTISLETIEHLTDPKFFMENLKSKELVFSVPLNSLSCSEWHTQDIRTIDDIKKIIKPFEIKNFYLQADRWIYGHALR